MIAMWGKEKAKIYITQNVPNIHKQLPTNLSNLIHYLFILYISFSGKQREPSDWLRGI